MQDEAGAPLKHAAHGDDGAPTVSLRHLAVLGACAAGAYALDQVTKAWAANALSDGQPRHLIGSILQLRLTFNPGAAFSFATNATWVLTLVAVAVIVAVLLTARRLHSTPWAMAFGFLVGGAAGNLTDRLVRAPGGGKGHVVDFLELPHWPIFNVADMSICTAAALFVVQSLRGIGLDGVRDADRGESSRSDKESV